MAGCLVTDVLAATRDAGPGATGRSAGTHRVRLAWVCHVRAAVWDHVLIPGIVRAQSHHASPGNSYLISK